MPKIWEVDNETEGQAAPVQEEKRFRPVPENLTELTDLMSRLFEHEQRLESLEGRLPKPETPEERERREIREEVEQLRSEMRQGLKGATALSRTALIAHMRLHGVPKDYWDREPEDRLALAMPSLVLTLMQNLHDVEAFISQKEQEGHSAGEAVLALAQSLAQHGQVPAEELKALKDPENVDELIELLEGAA